MLKMTVITVCRNECLKLKKTVESVCAQTYPHIEYLIIDGASSDGTTDMVREYALRYGNIRLYSEEDFGIYNAMNRGIARAGGDYVYFIHAGDTFYNKNVIEDVVNFMAGGRHLSEGSVIGRTDTGVCDEAVFYGKACLVSGDGSKKIQDFAAEEGTLEEKLLNGSMPCHQTVFAPRKLLADHYFRERYKIRADYEWLMYSVSRGNVCKAVPLIVSYYDTSGTSGRIGNASLFRKEQEEIVQEYQGKLEPEQKPVRRKETGSGQKDVGFKYLYMFQMLNQWMALRQRGIRVGDYLRAEGYRRIAIYGMGALGLRLADDLRDCDITVEYAVDRDAARICTELRVILPGEVLEDVDAMIVTAVADFREIQGRVQEKARFPVISLEDVVRGAGAAVENV